MRIEIKARNRLGISQDILTYFRENDCNLIATEVITHFMYVHFDASHLNFAQIEGGISKIKGVQTVIEIEMLPSERKQNQLNVLLSRLPDPILDIDNHGIILLANSAAARICHQSTEQLKGRNITDFVEEPLNQLLRESATTTEINILRQPFQADITPVQNLGNKTGAILVLRSPSRLGQQLSALQHTSIHHKEIVGNSDAIKSLLNKAQRFAQLDLPILIYGETGTGKELLARTLHNLSPNADAPFLAINCATLPENLLESELFGYAPGAFTGAQRGGKPGLFELAAGGSVFLDEIGEMSPYLQAKLLRFLQEFSFRRVGGTKEHKVKVTVISATHRNLEEMSHQGSFREDLYYRLNVLNLDIPALRNRAQDIPLLVEHFIAKAAKQVNTAIPTITPKAMSLLSQFDWPGNIRQLENLLFRTMALLDDTVLDSHHIQLPKEQELTIVDDFIDVQNWDEAQQRFEQRLLEKMYPQYPSTRKLAKRLGVSHNKIAMKLKRHGIG